MRNVLLIASLAALTASATAQCFDQAYGTSLGAGGDVMFPMQSIGFAFPFAGTTYTDIHITDKCYAFLSNANVPPAPLGIDFDATAAELVAGSPRICALWADIQCQASNNGEVFIKSTATTCTVTWLNAQCYSATSGIFNVQMELSITGSIKFLYGPGATNNSTLAAWQVGITGVSPGMGATQPASLDLSVGGSSLDNTVFEEFTAPNTFDMADNGLLMIPSNPGWTFVPLGAPANCATVSTFGSGCGQQIDSVYEEFTTAFDMNNTTVTWLRNPGGYTMLTGIPGVIVPPSGAAINIAPGMLDAEQVVTLTSAMPVAGGITTAFNITTKGQVEFANTNSGIIDYTPSGAEMLAWGRTAFHCWHDYNQVSPGSGLILFEEVAGVAYATWNGVHSFSNPTPSTFQFQFDLTTGNVTLVIGTMSGAVSPDAIVIGYSVGGASLDPGATDLSALAGVVTVNDIGAGLALATNGSPTLGNASFALETSNVNAIVPLAFLFFGDTAINPGIDLTFLGMPGCSAYTNANLGALTFPVAFPAGTGSVGIPIPNNASLVGASLTGQSLAFSTTTTAGLSSSNGVQFTVGN